MCSQCHILIYTYIYIKKLFSGNTGEDKKSKKKKIYIIIYNFLDLILNYNIFVWLIMFRLIFNYKYH